MTMNQMTKRTILLTFLAAILSFAFAPAASAEFGFETVDGELVSPDGSAATQAGAHPLAGSLTFRFNSHPESIPVLGPAQVPDGDFKDLSVELPPGLVGNPTVTPSRCTLPELVMKANFADCPLNAMIGYVSIKTALGGEENKPLYNMVPGPGQPAQFGFQVLGAPVLLAPKLRSDGDYGLTIDLADVEQAAPIVAAKTVLWGVPADPVHDIERCAHPSKEDPPRCTGNGEGENFFGESMPHSAGVEPVAFIRNPTACTPPGIGLETRLRADSWQDPGVFTSASFFSHLPAPEQETQVGPTGCRYVPFNPTMTATPTSHQAETSSGLSVSVKVPTTGLLNPTGIGQSDIKKTVVRLPEGVSINPAQGEGLGVCSPAQYESEELSFSPDPQSGCPGSSKIGTVKIETPLLERAVEGAVYVAEPDNPATAKPGAENPFDSLVALYIVAKNPQRGVMVKLAGKVEPDERTGQLVATFDEIPQLPVASFDLHFREGVRSPLSTPRNCGTYTTVAEFTPWSDPSRVIKSVSSFEITAGVGGSGCPAGSAPFNPKLSTGTLNNNALSYSPFVVRMSREDGEQEITNFSTVLPPGLSAKLAGIPRCSDADLAATARAPGRATIDGSICPAASQVGHVTVGYGVGSVQTHATGKVFLAGPYHGAPISIATVAPAVVGPFDLGTIVVRSAFQVNPETAEVELDSRASDPIPHILKGLELHLRDIRVYMDHPEFTFNPTSCDPMRVGAFLSGSGDDLLSSADDTSVDVSNRFQAANCSLLPFKPKLSFRMKGGTHRGDFPALRTTLRARKGDANIGRAVVTLPHSEFLEQGHIGTICTRVQFAADQCPAASVYGHVRAITPLLDQPLEGPVYLRSSSHVLPDLVAKLQGEIDVNVVGRIDSFHGGIRTTFATIPDTPVSKFTLSMQGGKKGLLVNSRNLCRQPGRADVHFVGQNGKVERLHPLLHDGCPRHKPHRRHPSGH